MALCPVCGSQHKPWTAIASLHQAFLLKIRLGTLPCDLPHVGCIPYLCHFHRAYPDKVQINQNRICNEHLAHQLPIFQESRIAPGSRDTDKKGSKPRVRPRQRDVVKPPREHH